MREVLEPLHLIDTSAAARPDEASVREWLAEQRVFVSSVIDGYRDIRSAAVAAIRESGAEPVYFEAFGGMDSDPADAYLGEVRSSSIYVGLLGARYGRPLPSRYSATHAEYAEAERVGLRTSMWVQDGVDREGPQQSFLDAVRVFDVTGEFAGPEDLQTGLSERLRRLAAEELSPWVKLGPVAFRAKEIVDRGTDVRVRAVIRDDEIVAWLREETSGFGRLRTTLTWPQRTALVELVDVEIVSRASRVVDVALTFKADEPGEPTTFTFQGATWEEQTALAIETSIFGRQDPVGAFGLDLSLLNPFPLLASLGVAEETVRPLARTILAEELRLRRGVRLTEFRLGRDRGGRRPMRVSFRSLPRHVRDRPELIEVGGDALTSTDEAR
jgi:hypothetical protein